MSRLRIVKVGGSLLTLDDLPERLNDWLSAQSPAVNVLLAGGGPLADAVREWDSRFGLGEERSHWLCVDLLDVTARLLNGLLPASEMFASWEALQERAKLPRCLVFAPTRFLRDEESSLPGRILSRSWRTTSDSIAARLAEVTGADELVLLKAAPPPTAAAAADSAGYVDQDFVQASRMLTAVRLVDLRNTDF